MLLETTGFKPAAEMGNQILKKRDQKNFNITE